jgi:hypothetical protein
MSDALLEYSYTDTSGTRRRVEIVARADGDGCWLAEYEKRGCSWRCVGREPVTDVAVTAREALA